MKDLHNEIPSDLETKDAGGGNDAPDTTEIKRLLDGFDSTLDAFMKKTDTSVKEVKEALKDPVTQDELAKITAALEEQKTQVKELRLENQRPIVAMADGTKKMMTEDEVKHVQSFNDFFRKGNDEGLRELEQKTLSVGSDPDGGYVVPTQMESAIDRVISEVSPMRQVARIVSVSTASYKKRVTTQGASSGWVAEQGSRGNTDTPKMDVLEFPVMELYANPSATQSLLDDAALDIGAWIGDEVNIEFAEQEGAAFISGNGATRPQGFLSTTKVEEDNWSWGSLGYRATGVSGDFADSSSDPGAETTNIVDLVYGLKSIFRNNASFMFNRKTASTLMKLRDADGRPLWSSGLREGQPDRLIGYRVVEAEDMPDIAANAFAMAFGDFRRGYTIVDRIGIRVLRDPYSAKPYVQFYTTKRVGGGVSHYEAIKLLKFGTS